VEDIGEGPRVEIVGDVAALKKQAFANIGLLSEAAREQRDAIARAFSATSKIDLPTITGRHGSATRDLAGLKTTLAAMPKIDLPSINRLHESATRDLAGLKTTLAAMPRIDLPPIKTPRIELPPITMPKTLTPTVAGLALGFDDAERPSPVPVFPRAATGGDIMALRDALLGERRRGDRLTRWLIGLTVGLVVLTVVIAAETLLLLLQA
jgi:hypothetical protein